MNNTKLSLALVLFLSYQLIACGQAVQSESPLKAAQAEWEENAPIDGTDGLTPETAADAPRVFTEDTQTYFFPKWESAMGVSEKIFTRAQAYYNQHWVEFPNRRYVVLIDLGQHSSKKRFLLIDLKTGKYERHNTAHGAGSDPNADGWVDSFSNVSGSNKSSVGFYKTLYTYNGKNGRSLRIDGLESTNSNALARAIVVHGANYVSDKNSSAGRSNGCPALDHAVVQTVIDKIRDGAMLLIATSRAL